MEDRRHFEELGLKELIVICDKRGLDSSLCESKAEVIDLLLSNSDKKKEGEENNEIQNTKPRAHSDSDNDYRQDPKQASTNSNISSGDASTDFPYSSRYRFSLTNTIPVNSSTEKTFTAYLVEVVDENSQQSKTLLKRYRQFDELNENVKKYFANSKIPKLPSKKFVGNLNPEFVHKRCKKLENYLNMVAQLEGIFDLPFMREFLEQADLEPRAKKKSGSIPINKSNSFLTARSVSSKQIAMKKSKENTNVSSSSASPQSSGGFLYQTSLSDRPSSPPIYSYSSSSSGKISKYDELSSKAQKILTELKKVISSSSSSISNEEMELNLSDCGVSSIPAFYFDDLPADGLARVTKLNMSNNKMSITTSLSKYFKYLHTLNISGNNISYVDVGSLENLTWLDLSRNSIKSISKELSKLVSIRHLDLSFNQLSYHVTSPDDKEDSSEFSRIFTLTNLNFLNLSNNPLLNLHPFIGKLRELQYLNVSTCELSDLPDEILTLDKLEDLNLSHNDLTDLPTDINKLSNLRRLDITVTNSRDLPISIGKCTQLEEIKLDFKESEVKNKEIDSNLLLHYRRGFDQFFAFLKSRAEGNPQTPEKLKDSSNSVGSASSTNLSSSDEKQKDKPVDEKVMVIKQWGVNEIKDFLLPHLAQLKKEISNATSVTEAKDAAQSLRTLKDVIDEASKYNYWIRVKVAFNKLEEKEKANSPNASINTNNNSSSAKLQSLKDIAFVVVFDLQLALSAVIQVLENSILPQEVIQLVKVIKTLKQTVENKNTTDQK